MKKAEAKILVFLNNADTRYKYANYISIKLDADYNWTTKTLNRLLIYKLVSVIQRGTRKYYELTSLGKQEVETAKRMLSHKRPKQSFFNKLRGK